MTLCLLSGPGTIVPPRNVGLLDLAPSKDDELYVHQLNEDHRLFFHGDFTRFHTYLIVTHTKFRVIPESVKQTAYDKFESQIYFESEAGKGKIQLIKFNSPLLPIRSVKPCKYGRDYDSFELELFNGYASQKFYCNLSFITGYGTNLEAPVPLKIEYIGMAAKNGRTAQERLGEGHDKLQLVLGELNDRDLFRSVSLVLYKPGELECDGITFPQVVETFEASLIQHFKPEPLNTEHLNFPNNKTKLTGILESIGASHILTKLDSPENTRLYSKHNPQPQSEHVFDVYLR